MMDLDTARRRVSERVRSLPPVTRAVFDGGGLVLATPATAGVDHPPLDVSSMDGYAARASELPCARRPVAFEVPAGASPPALPAGHVARIFTGAPLPPGADCVVRQELAVAANGHVDLPPTPVGHFVRRAGEVFAAGETILEAGRRLTPTRLALLAAGGVSTVDVVPAPRVSVVVTGGEIVAPGDRSHEATIYDSNGPMLAALGAHSTGESVTVHRTPDTLDRVIDTIRRAAVDADLVLTSGGVSVGDHDLVPLALAALDAEVVFHGIRVKPGKPLLVARANGTWIVGLPGNPVSALVGWRLFAHPIARALAGTPDAFVETPRTGRLENAHDNRGDRIMMRPALARIVDGEPRLSFMRWKGSHDLVGAAAANGLVRIEAGTAVGAGDRVPFYEIFPSTSE